ncbi:MAG TPA: NAD(P)/FAD-dependent oxidoreductase [Baekduia sp.]|nr:NAD(P)/FAD-dependent oxidoreductase [Baekduia sp.]
MTRSPSRTQHRVDTVVIGAGQAGLALSHHLTAAGHDHVVLERGRVGERWRSERWPSLRLLTPNWLNRLPGAPAPEDADGFQAASGFVADLERYAASFGAPVREQEPVRWVAPVQGAGGYVVATPRSVFHARHVVIATGDCAVPRVPAAAATVPAGVRSLHAAAYTAPDALPAGPVLVVGAGATGQQLAAELARAGRRVVIAAGGHARMPRRYRGRDAFAWLHAIGALDERIEDHPEPERARRAHSFVLSGADGGTSLDLNVLQDLGVEAAGRLRGFDGGRALLARDLDRTAAAVDERLAELLERFDAAATAAAAPVAPPDRPPPLACGPGPATVDVGGFGAVLWATGYGRAYPWLRVPVLDAAGEVVHDRGATGAPGLHVLGLRFQRRRSSHFIGGVGRDAAELAAALVAGRGAEPEPVRAAGAAG